VTSLETMPIIDCDTHVTEPPDLWTARLSARRWGDEVPHLEFDPVTGNRRWRVGRALLTSEAKYSMAGWKDYSPSYPPSLEEADPASWNPDDRLVRMDEYGISAQVLYPNIVSFYTKAFMQLSDPDLALECVSAYNDFLIDFSSTNRNRLIPIMMLPFWDLEASERELERAAAIGHKGVLLAAHFEKLGLPDLWDPHWERLLSAIQDHDLSINFHVGVALLDDSDISRLYDRRGADHARGTSISMLGNARAIADVVCTGLCARYPGLNFVSVESGAGWLLYLMESLDWHWKNYGAVRDHPDRELPSFYFKRQIFGSFWFERDSARLATEHFADNLMFETDFPHPTSLSPGPASAADRPRDMAIAALSGVSMETAEKVLYQNAQRLYHVELPT
jgi:uncharacterized protein